MVSKAKKEKKKRKLSSARKTAEKGSTFERTALNVPDGIKFFKPKKEGIYRLDLIPYEVGKGNPNAESGVVHYERTFFVHRGIGPNNDSYICPRKNSGKKCPICEHRAKLLRDPDANEDEVKALAEKKRQLFRVINHAERDAGIQLWDESYHLFGKHLDKKIKSADDEDQEKYDNFHDPETGLMLKVNVSEENGGGYTFYDAGDIEFKERREQYEESIIDEGPNLDELIKELSYAELKKIFLQTEDEDDEDEEEEEDEDADDDSDDDEEDEDEKPAKGKGKAKPKKKEEDDEDEEEDDDDDEEATCPVKVGDLIKWEYKGKARTGIVTKINTKAENFYMKSDDRTEPYTIGWDDEDVTVLPKKGKKKLDLDDEDEEEEEDEKPAKGKGKAKPKKEEDDEEEDDEDEDEESDDDSDDDEEEEEDEEEDEPAPKKKVKVKAKGKGKAKDDVDDDDDDIPFDDDEDEDDDSEDEETAKKSSKKKK